MLVSFMDFKTGCLIRLAYIASFLDFFLRGRTAHIRSMRRFSRLP